MTGHIVKKVRGGRVRYYAVVELEVDPETGNRHRKSHGGFDRKRDAQKALNEILHRMESGTYIEPSRQTIGGYLLEEWLPAIRATVKSSTWDSYYRNLRLHVVPQFGTVPLAKLTPGHLNTLYASLAEREPPLAAKTIRYIHTTIHRALRDAVRWQKVARNVAALADPPRPKVAEGFKVWSPDQVRRFLDSVRDDRLRVLYMLALTTGMRRGEILGLRWNDINFDGGKLSIRQTLVAIAYRVEMSEPKTSRSRRTIALDPATVTALRTLRSRQLEERLAWGPTWKDTGLVFTNEDGSLVHPHAVSQAFERAVKRAGLPVIRFHDMRHTYATLALEAGMKPWDLSDRLGHSSVAFTLNVYRHAVQATQHSAASAAAAFILGNSQS